MSPIKEVSDIRRMPRLGKIRLGIKVQPEDEGKNPYPRATDYFVVPEEIKAFVGEFPKKLNIIFPSEEVDKIAQQWLRCYSLTQGQICKGDGVTATRKIDTENGDIARHTTVEWEFRDGWGCDPNTCAQYLEKQCRRVMNLLFMMPDVPGLGCWQLDTTSFYSIVNVNSCLAWDGLIRRICGRISFIPLTLSLEPQEVSPLGITKKTVHVLFIRSEVKLADLQRLALVPPERVMLPTLQEEEPPEDLFPEQIIKAEASIQKGKEEAPAPEPVEQKNPDDVVAEDVPDLDAAFRICHHLWADMQPLAVCKELGFTTPTDAYEAYRGKSGWEAFLTIKRLKQPEELSDEESFDEL